MKIKVSETTRIQLDWLVAKCEAEKLGKSYVPTPKGKFFINSPMNPKGRLGAYSPSVNWAQGGPILEKMLKSGVTTWNFMGECFFELAEENILQNGSTPLIAGLRCYCCSKLGDEVEIPEELL